MIIKKITNRTKSSKHARIKGLASYIMQPQNSKAEEKCIYSGSRNFALANDLQGYIAEMTATALDASRSKDPVNHYVISWRVGENPTNAQIEECVDIFLKQNNFHNCQCLYALHNDTDHKHLHIMVNRIDTINNKIVNVGRYDVNNLHKSVAIIEKKQGWAIDNKLYSVNENDEFVTKKLNPEKADISFKSKDIESKSGLYSIERFCKEKLAPTIFSANSWESLHIKLAELGVSYKKQGSGAVVSFGDTVLKASSVHKRISLKNLEKKLGPYQGPPNDLQIKPFKLPVINGAEQYIREKQKLQNEKKQLRQHLREQHRQEFLDMLDNFKQQRKEVFEQRESWKGHGHELNLLRSLLACDQAQIKARLRKRQAQERKKLKERYWQNITYKEWQQIHQNQILPLNPESIKDSKFFDIEDYVAEQRPAGLFYSLQGSQDVAFIDVGRKINIIDDSDESILAALQLGQAKFGVVTLNGDDEFKNLACRVAAENGIKVANPELQSLWHETKEHQYIPKPEPTNIDTIPPNNEDYSPAPRPM